MTAESISPCPYKPIKRQQGGLWVPLTEPPVSTPLPTSEGTEGVEMRYPTGERQKGNAVSQHLPWECIPVHCLRAYHLLGITLPC